MGNKKNGGRSKKRKFQGNRFTQTNPNGTGDNNQPTIDNVNIEQDSCPSAKKLKPNEGLEYKQSTNEEDGFILMDVRLLFQFLTANMTCEECKHRSVTCKLNVAAKNGYAHEIVLECANCEEWQAKFCNSDSGTINNHKEVNVRMVSFVRSIGRGHSALQNFSTYMNTPQPMTYPNYMKIFKKIHSASKDVANESMEAAAKEVIEESRSSRPCTSNARSSEDEDEVESCAVSMDGTWQRRGHASHHGVVTSISVSTGKCVDTEVLSNICKGCRHWETKKGTEEYEKWRLTHDCRINHTGSAGAMEAVGAVRIFARSEQIRNLRYTQYLGDGDSASFKKVTEAKPYGEDREIEKLECVGHVQKRCGTRLRRLVNESKGLKLSDGKGLGGLGRLTSKKIDTLQNYYGFAIRQNAGNLEQMQADVKAVLYHVASSAKNPMHDLCPTDSWCKYKLDKENYKHKNGLPETVVEYIKPVFDDLADEKLLRKCLHGKTQNNNECLNKMIWDRCSKEYFVEKETIEHAVFTAVSYFNDGAKSIIRIFQKLGFHGGYTAMGCVAKDHARIAKSTVKSSEATKKRRKTIRAIMKGYKDTTEAQEGDMYSPGGH